ncbi:MAG TPA: hypothetical protein ENN23_04560 [Deltaproteobacteria bacterium]|nr:hypothetical protein [Deltaproteobacteria bacterium]
MFNVLREVFPQRRIDKSHNYDPKYLKYPVIVTYRHPLDAMASSIQRYDRIPSDEEVENQIKEFADNGIWDILKIRGQENVLMLRYELFYNNYDHIFAHLEGFFSIAIPAEKRRYIAAQYNIEAVDKIVRNYDAFHDYDSVTQLHGKHISAYKGNINYYREFFSPKQIDYLRKVYHKFLVEFGYE